jgi:cell division protein FtsX
MSDFDRDGERPVERDRVTERTTTVIDTGGDRGRGGGVLIAVVLLILVLAVLFFLFGGNLNRAADKVGVDVNVDAPKVETPDINIDVPEKIDVEGVELSTDGNGSE